MIPSELSGRAFAALVGITPMSVSRLTADGVIERLASGKYDAAGSLKKYCENIRTVAAGRGGRETVEALSRERARLAREQADGMAIKNAQLRKELVNVADVEFTWATMVRDIRAGMLSIPARIQGRHSVSREIVAAVDDEIREVLTIMGRSEDPTAPTQPPN